jgi:hypothetical protein
MKSLEKRVTDMLTVAALLMTFGSSPMNAQTTTADIEAGTAKYAATYVRNSRPSARFALDTTSRGGLVRSAADVARLARILRVDVLAAGDSAVICPGDPSTCRLRPDFDAIVGIRADPIGDSTAEATIELRAATGLARVPIVFETRRVRLVRRGSCWIFDRELWLEVSLLDTARQRMKLE